ncbi:MAG TPA: hypothetical protein VFQ92_05495, partial [Blastocatellia bacterium]|nr:hypothetical protein [Blastocatellia bacterium]
FSNRPALTQLRYMPVVRQLDDLLFDFSISRVIPKTLMLQPPEIWHYRALARHPDIYTIRACLP